MATFEIYNESGGLVTTLAAQNIYYKSTISSPSEIRTQAGATTLYVYKVSSSAPPIFVAGEGEFVPLWVGKTGVMSWESVVAAKDTSALNLPAMYVFSQGASVGTDKFGLQTFDAAGNLQFSSSSRPLTIHSFVGEGRKPLSTGTKWGIVYMTGPHKRVLVNPSNAFTQIFGELVHISLSAKQIELATIRHPVPIGVIKGANIAATNVVSSAPITAFLVDLTGI